VYGNAIGGINKEYNLGDNHITNARAGMAWFLILYGIGCELWAPFSEEYGRVWFFQKCLGTVKKWQILAGASTQWSMVLTARLLGGLSSAGGSVTLGMVADMFDPEDQQYAVLWASLWSCLGSGMLQMQLYEACSLTLFQLLVVLLVVKSRSSSPGDTTSGFSLP
jgi:MFS family permease